MIREVVFSQTRLASFLILIPAARKQSSKLEATETSPMTPNGSARHLAASRHISGPRLSCKALYGVLAAIPGGHQDAAGVFVYSVRF